MLTLDKITELITVKKLYLKFVQFGPSRFNLSFVPHLKEGCRGKIEQAASVMRRACPDSG